MASIAALTQTCRVECLRRL